MWVFRNIMASKHVISCLVITNSHIFIQKQSELGLWAVEDGMWITNMRTAAIAVYTVIEYSRSDVKMLGFMKLGLIAWTR